MTAAVSEFPGGTVLERRDGSVLVGVRYGECVGAPAHVTEVDVSAVKIRVVVEPVPATSGPRSACADRGGVEGVEVAVREGTSPSTVEVRYRG